MTKDADKRIIGVALKLGEARNREKIDEIARVLELQPNVVLLDLRIREDSETTLIKFVSEVSCAVRALLPVCQKIFELLDYSQYPPYGKACGSLSSVVFIPVRNLTLKECEIVIENFAQAIYQQFSQPVYFMGPQLDTKITNAQTRNELIRYTPKKQLNEVFEKNNIRPDIGESGYDPTKGVTFIGLRRFVVTISFYLDTEDVELAEDIAEEISATGVKVYDREGQPVLDSSGEPIRKPGKFPNVDAIAIGMAEERLTRIICNLQDYTSPNIFELYDEIKKVADQYMVEILGSNIIGFLPWEAIEIALESENSTGASSYPEQIERFKKRLGLDLFSQFNPQWQIIDFRFIPYHTDNSQI
ncbi:MAG: hypothetical protein Kow0037_32070 [Calditrichia bacterium]